MRKYSVVDYPQNHKLFFQFLLNDYKYFIFDEKENDFGYVVEYRNDKIRLHFNYDIRDNFFYFNIIKGLDTVYPNDKDNANIITFYDLFLKYEPSLDIKKIQPDKKQYIKSLEFNSILLKKYGDGILKGTYWP